MIWTSFLPRGKLKLENESSLGGILLLTTYSTASKIPFGGFPDTQLRQQWLKGTDSERQQPGHADIPSPAEVLQP